MKHATKKLNFQMSVVSTKDASGECMIEGYANTSSKDRVGDVVVPDAFAKSLEVYLKNPVLLLNHDWNDVIGRTTHAEITDKGLYIKARISDTRNDIKTLVREKCYSTFSIGYNELDADYDESTKTKYIKELELLEISVVSVPANTEAMFTQIEAKTETDNAQAEKIDDEKKAKKASSLKAFLSTVKHVVGDELDEKSLLAVIDYFNSNEDVMTKEQLIEALRVKTLPATTAAPTDAKADAPAPNADKPADAPAGDDLLKAIAAKLDALAEAMAQVMEGLNKDSAEDAQEDQADAPADEAKKDDPAKKPAEDMPKDDEACKECSGDDSEKDLTDSDIEKQLTEIHAQLDALDEEING